MMTRLVGALVVLCGLAVATDVTVSSMWNTPFGVLDTYTTPNACFGSTQVQVQALQYQTSSDKNGGTTTAGMQARGCKQMAASGTTLPTWFQSIYSDRVWAVDRSGQGRCLDTGNSMTSASGGNTIAANIGSSFRPVNSDQTYELLVLRELFACQYDSNTNNTNALKKPATAWRAERFNIYRSDGYNMKTFSSISKGSVGFMNQLGQLVWNNPNKNGMNTKWSNPFEPLCSGNAQLINEPGCDSASCTQVASIPCATSNALVAFSGVSSWDCKTNNNGVINAGVCTQRTRPNDGLSNSLFGADGLFTKIQSWVKPTISAFQNQNTNGWALDASRKFYVSDNQLVNVSFSGTSSSALDGRQSASATNNQLFNNKIFIDTSIAVSTALPAVSLKQVNYNSQTNSATFRAADGKCKSSNNMVQCGGNNGFVVGQQYWAKVQSNYMWEFTAECKDITGSSNFPYVYMCDGDYTTATSNGATYNNADNTYPTVQRQFRTFPDSGSNGNQEIVMPSEVTIQATSDPVYLGFLSYGVNEEYDVAPNWVAETRPFEYVFQEDRKNVNPAKPIYVPQLIGSEQQYENWQNNLKVADKTESENYNYAVGLIGAGVVVFAVFFLVAACTFSAAYVKANQNKNRDLTAGDLTFSKSTELART